MTINELQNFFHERPLLTAHGFALEAGISPRLMAYILTGERKLTDKTIRKILPTLIKYGYKNEQE